MSRLGKWLVAWLTPLCGVALVLLGLAAVGKLARDHLRNRDRYSLHFADIDCTPPPGMSREDFLDEVRYLSGMAEPLRLLDADVTARLADAFARHPWVERVERVEIVPPGKVQVRLTHRTPVLAVLLPRTANAPDDGYARIESRSVMGRNALAAGRVVDGQGILLPTRTPIARELPVLYRCKTPPAGRAGTPWGDPMVEAAARTASFLRASQGRLRLQDIEVSDEGVVLRTGPQPRHFLWGQPPGREAADEASAAEKLQRLLDYCQRPVAIGAAEGPVQYDLRPRDRVEQRPLSSGARP
jgi:hypothetical protein